MIRPWDGSPEQQHIQESNGRMPHWQYMPIGLEHRIITYSLIYEIILVTFSEIGDWHISPSNWQIA